MPGPASRRGLLRSAGDLLAWLQPRQPRTVRLPSRRRPGRPDPAARRLRRIRAGADPACSAAGRPRCGSPDRARRGARRPDRPRPNSAPAGATAPTSARRVPALERLPLGKLSGTEKRHGDAERPPALTVPGTLSLRAGLKRRRCHHRSERVKLKSSPPAKIKSAAQRATQSRDQRHLRPTGNPRRHPERKASCQEEAKSRKHPNGHSKPANKHNHWRSPRWRSSAPCWLRRAPPGRADRRQPATARRARCGSRSPARASTSRCHLPDQRSAHSPADAPEALLFGTMGGPPGDVLADRLCRGGRATDEPRRPRAPPPRPSPPSPPI